MKVKITSPCLENWDKMKADKTTRFCDSCNKNVMDFTLMNKNEIISLMLQNRNNHICGRMSDGLMEFSSEELMQVIDKELAKNTRTNYGFYLMLLGTLTMMNCNNGDSKLPAASTVISTTKQKTEMANSTSVVEIVKKTSHKLTAKEAICKQEDDKGVKTLKGEGATSDNKEIVINAPVGGTTIIQNTNDPNFIYTNVEHLPMFIGGTDALGKFITENLSYPNWEKKQRIEGRVFIQFVVEKDGRVSYPLVLRVSEGSINLGNEAIRITQMMPKWEPGRNNKEVVRTSYVLPILFTLPK